jgi:hypothetical protein
MIAYPKGSMFWLNAARLRIALRGLRCGKKPLRRHRRKPGAAAIRATSH